MAGRVPLPPVSGPGSVELAEQFVERGLEPDSASEPVAVSAAGAGAGASEVATACSASAAPGGR
eukprot:9192558-Pyramimonas_sp.AAC.1